MGAVRWMVVRRKLISVMRTGKSGGLIAAKIAESDGNVELMFVRKGAPFSVGS